MRFLLIRKCLLTHFAPSERIEASGRAVVDAKLLALAHAHLPRRRNQQVDDDVDGHDVKDGVALALHRTQVAASRRDKQIARSTRLLNPALY